MRRPPLMTVGSDYATTLSVYTGSRGALSQVACASFPAQVTFNATANTTYFFMIASASGGPGGTLVFNVTEGPPTNDEISGATPLTLNTTVTEDTTLATSAPTDPTTCLFSPHNTVWFSFTPTQSQRLVLDRSGSSYDGRVSVLTDLGSGPVVIACGGAFDATAGKTYYFMDASFFGGGQLQVTLRPAIVMTVTIDQIVRVDRQGVATVTGTLACNPATGISQFEQPTLAVDLRQRVNRTLVIEGSNSLRIPCPAISTGWSVTIIGSNGPFFPGQGEVFVTGFACDASSCDQPEVSRLVMLRRQT